MKFAEWIFYVGCGSIAILFVYKGGDIEQFQSKATNFKMEQVLYTKRPVITVCPEHWLENNKDYEYSTDFNISIGSSIAKLGTNSIKCSDFGVPDGADYYTYDDCDYVEDSDKEDSTVSFVLEEVFSNGHGFCYNIVHDPDRIYDWKVPIQISLKYDDSIPSDKLPGALNVYITSYDNYHGAIFGTWMEGNELYKRFPRKGDDGWAKNDYWMKIESSKHIFLEETSNCSNFEVLYDCLAKKLIKLADFKHCTKKCLPSGWSSTFSSTDSLEMPFCEEFEDDICAIKTMRRAIGFSFLMHYLSLCPKSCTTQEYTGSVDYMSQGKGIIYMLPSKNATYFSLVVRYKAPGTEYVYEEYLIVDFYGMVSVVGGTMGLFIGFSFFNVITFLIDLIKNLYKKYKNQIITEEIISSNMVEVVENQKTQIKYILEQLEILKNDKKILVRENTLFK